VFHALLFQPTTGREVVVLLLCFKDRGILISKRSNPPFQVLVSTKVSPEAQLLSKNSTFNGHDEE
jgi:hypothetical protein